MRVGFFSTGINVASGFGRVCKYLTRGLISQGFLCSQFNLQYFGDPITIDGVRTYQGGDQDIRWFPRYLDEEKPDVVIFHRSAWDLCPNLPHSWPGGAILQALKRRKTKFILYSPLEHAKGNLEWLMNLWNAYPETFVRIAAVSEWSGTQFALAGWRDVAVIRHGVDTQCFRPDGVTRKRKDGAWTVGMVGANQRRKDFPCLIEAYRYLTTYSDPSLMGKLALYLHTAAVSPDRDLIDLTSGDPMIEFPYPPLDEKWGADDAGLASLYRGFDVYVHLQKAGGFEMPLLEAMACGVPIIVADNSCAREVVGDAGIFIPPWREEHTNKGIWWLTSPVAVAKAILQTMDDDYRQKTVSGNMRLGLERVKNFTWQRSVQALLTILEGPMEREGGNMNA